jgi:hypothetical protein
MKKVRRKSPRAELAVDGFLFRKRKDGQSMSDADATTLTLQEVTDIITKAQSAGANPMLAGMQIFNSLGDSVTVSGDTLRLALTAAAMPITPPVAPLVSAIQSVSKTGTHVTTQINPQTETTLNGTRLQFKEELSFDVSEVPDTPALDNICGLSAHHDFWIGIKSLQLSQNQGHWNLAVVTSMKTVNIPLD